MITTASRSQRPPGSPQSASGWLRPVRPEQALNAPLEGLSSGRLGNALLDHLVGKRTVELGQMVELGLVSCKALALRAELGLEARKLGFGNQGVDPVPACPAVARSHAEHLASSACDCR